MKNIKTRKEKDSLGSVEIPVDAYYGAQTERARQNFTDSGLRLPSVFIRSLATIKRFAAAANRDLQLLDSKTADIIMTAAQEVTDGKFDDAFVVDLFQTGSGTSTNMNMNEVIASRANELLTGKKSGRSPVHPNDHVNLGQSSNDVIPSVIHVAGLTSINNELNPALEKLQTTLMQKASEFAGIRKIGRTHLQDAVPIYLGDEFGGYARQVALSIKRIENASENLRELPLGGTAVGNGLNTHPKFADCVIQMLSAHLKIDFSEAAHPFEAQSARDAAVEMSGALKTTAVSLTKIANDIRWLASGPRCGLGEIRIPSLQPGSSIMPGKVNPVIPESVLQIAAQVMGNDLTITLAGQGGNFELNVMMPVMAYNLLQSISILSIGARSLAEKCIQGIRADVEKCTFYVDKSLALATYLVPQLGYDKAAAVSKKAHVSGKRIADVVLEEGIMTQKELDKLIR
ncbi:MAG: class II fumarate hydratase [Desulfobacterales bacterium]|nr:class II fumarate hydratase [Desulfobacterales bacterium]MDX2510956.1 class II fumarate hydratase [Desulfobacterales bacterium]